MSELRLDKMEMQDVEEEMAQWMGLRQQEGGDGERGGGRPARACVTVGRGESRGSQCYLFSHPAAPALI